MRTVANLALLLLLCGGQASAAEELTDAQRLDIVESVSLTADVMISLSDAADPAYFDFYSDWVKDPRGDDLSLPGISDWSWEPWWDGQEQPETEVGELNALVLSSEAVLFERTDVHTFTQADGSRLEERWVSRQLWRKEADEWNVLFEDLQLLGSGEIQ